MRRSRIAKYLTAAAAMVAALTVAGCSNDEPPAVCSAVEALEESVTNVTTVDIKQGALTELRDNLTEVQSDLTRLRDDAGDEFAPDIDAVEQAASSVGSTLEAGIASPSSQAISDIGAAVEDLGDSLSALEDAVTSTC